MKKWRLIPFLLALVMLLSACGGETEPPAESGSAPDVTAPVAQPVDISGYKIIYPLLASDTVKDAVRTMINEIKEATGVKLKMGNDVLADDTITNYESPDAEILIGVTNRRESQEASKALDGAFAYNVSQLGNKVVAVGGSDEATLEAMKHLTAIIVAGKKLEIAGNYSYTNNYLTEKYPEGSPMYSVTHNYTIVFDASNLIGEKELSVELATRLSSMSDVPVTSLNDMAAKEVEKEILVGCADRDEIAAAYAGIGYYEYRVAVKGGKICVLGGSSMALKKGADVLVERLMDGTLDPAKDQVVSGLSFDLQRNDALIDNFDKFVPTWAGEYKAPDWMHDFEEKTYAVVAPNKSGYRVTMKSHRGDMPHYPEGSLEGIASVIYAGFDCIEVDVRMTKDGIAVISHDASLARMTDVDVKMGKNGLPHSDKVVDWTYDEIRQLNLRTGYGGEGSTVTEYKIPTLMEVLELCSGRLFVQVDDKSKALVDEDGNVSYDLYLMAAATDSKESFFYFYGLGMMQAWATRDPSDTEFAAYVEKVEKYLSKSGHGIRRVWWPNDAGTSWGSSESLKENPTKWNSMISQGRMMIWSENPVALSRFVSSNFGACTVPK